MYIFSISTVSKVYENRIIHSGLHSIIAKFKKSYNQKILRCGSYFEMSFNEYFIFPENIKINNESPELYNSENSYNLTEEINIIEYFWENDNITTCLDMFAGCENIIELNFSNFNSSNLVNTVGMFSGLTNLVSLDLSNFDT